MADVLTPQQQMAVSDRGGNLLVSAAAGSGKTKVLVDRLLSYIMDPMQPANIDDFLIITYTKAAAAELREKIASKLNERISENPENRHLHRQLQRLYLTKISTVHSFCSDVLRQYAYILNLPGDFSVLDDREGQQLKGLAMEQVLEACYSSDDPDLDFYSFLESQGFHRKDDKLPELIMDLSSRAQCHLQPEQWMLGCAQRAQVEGVTEASQTIWGKFLIDDLHEAVDQEIKTLSLALKKMEGNPDFEGAAAVLGEIVVQYQKLLEADTWDGVHEAAKIKYRKLSFKDDAKNTQLSDEIKVLKALVKEHMDAKLVSFANNNAQIMQDLRKSAAAARGFIRVVKQFQDAYSKLKQNMRCLDYSDLEHLTLDLFYGKSRCGITSVANEIAEKYREVMVDEYQDSNAIQDAIFSALSHKKHNLFLVGDVKQSIYQFRLADPDIFLQKYNSFAPAGQAQPGEGRKVFLSSNFRSGGGILDGVNDVFKGCMSQKVGGLDYGEAEALVEGLPHVPLQEPEIQLIGLQTKDESNLHEANMVAKRISELLDGTHMVRDGKTLRKVTADDIVILLRSPSSQASAYKEALEALGIACADDVEDKLFDAEEICTLRSLLTVINNPRQDIPLVATIATPIFGFTADDLAQLRGADRRASIYDLLVRSDNSKAKHFLQILNKLRMEAKLTTISGLIEKVYLHTDLDSIYGAMANSSLRMERLEAFYTIAVDFDKRSNGGLEQFLANLDIMEQNGTSIEPAKQPNCVRILSIHKSKGLEYPIVFLSGMSKRFNKKDTQKKVLLDKELGVGLSCTDNDSRLCYPSIAKTAIAVKMVRDLVSEEMRILYVAMTRPRDRLIMTFSYWTTETAFGDLALRLCYSDPVMVYQNVNNHISWVLSCVLHKTEAGEILNQCICHPETRSDNTVWDIHLVTPENSSQQGGQEETKPVEASVDVSAIREALAFQYPFQPATVTPSKQTATQLKERYLDTEVSEKANRTHQNAPWRQPSFISGTASSVHRGNAIHAVMQYVDFAKCTDEQMLLDEFSRLVSVGLVTQEQIFMVDAQKILSFFESDLGRRLMVAKKVYREFKFSVLVSTDKSAEQADKVLLQGVVDCAIMDDDGIVVIDFKSDRVTAETISLKNTLYAGQVNAYAMALAEVFQLPVKEKWLYYFDINQGVLLNM